MKNKLKILRKDILMTRPFFINVLFNLILLLLFYYNKKFTYNFSNKTKYLLRDFRITIKWAVYIIIFYC